MDVLQMSILSAESADGHPFLDGTLLNFHNDINCASNEYSFLNDPMNNALTSVDTRGYILFGIMSNDLKRQELFSIQKENPVPNRARLGKWLRAVEQFVLLAIAVHISGGQPARGKEVTSYTVCNVRGLYWVQDTIMLCQSYSKTRARFLSQKICRILLAYLGIVRPMEIYVRYLNRVNDVSNFFSVYNS
jgi:hypothetical protein